jgi:hypothetical protein
VPGTSERDGERVQCSAKGCRADAAYVLVWNNPRVHTPEREKTWAACEDHRVSLGEFLDVRGFLRRVDPLETGPVQPPTGPAEPGLRCGTCGARFPAQQDHCPVCAGVRPGSCGGRD